MKNITVSVSDEAHRQARVWAAERGTSHSRIVAYLLETLPQIKRAERRFSVPNQPAPPPPVPTSPVPTSLPLPPTSHARKNAL